MAITFHEEVPVSLKRRRALKEFLVSLFRDKGKSLGSLDIIFCSDEYLKKINKQFLNHDYFTDIITFNFSDKPEQPILGEIYISIDRVKENAQTYQSSLNKELHRIIFHGALHLCGYKDLVPSDKAIMSKEEDKCLASYL